MADPSVCTRPPHASTRHDPIAPCISWSGQRGDEHAQAEDRQLKLL